MKFNFENLIPNEEVIKIFESFEELGYDIICREGIQYQWGDPDDFMLFEAKISNSNTNTFSIIKLPKKCFKKKEPLKPYVWYPAEEFDGNPNNYILLEADDTGLCYLYNFEGNRLSEYRSHFMYIERLKEI